MVTWRKRLNVWRFIAIFCYAIKTNSRTIRSQVSQPASAGKGTNMSEQIKHIRTVVHSQPNSLKCKLANRISFNVFDRCFCRVETKSCEKLRICAKRLGGLAVTILPWASRSFNPALVTPGALFTTCAPFFFFFFFSLALNLKISLHLSGLPVWYRIRFIWKNPFFEIPNSYAIEVKGHFCNRKMQVNQQKHCWSRFVSGGSQYITFEKLQVICTPLQTNSCAEKSA